jgi:hypothetical protein
MTKIGTVGLTELVISSLMHVSSNPHVFTQGKWIFYKALLMPWRTHNSLYMYVPTSLYAYQR